LVLVATVVLLRAEHQVQTRCFQQLHQQAAARVVREILVVAFHLTVVQAAARVVVLV
jgi:hypothetical protein